VTFSCLWGLICLSGYAIALMGWPVYPFPLLALPLYPLVLVYGILRYGVFVANAWAGRALVWTLLLALGGAVMAVLPLLVPFESRWLSGLAVAASCLALSGPVRRFVQRLIYPGGEVAARDLGAWRESLSQAGSFEELADTAGKLLSRRLGIGVQVDFGTPPQPVPAIKTPRMTLHQEAGTWLPRWHDWEAAPPGQRHVAELFATVLTESAQRLEQARQLAAREREQQLQARLAELGSLAATVAHDIRNPLNIISMAVALAPEDTRREVSVQVGRIAHLASDLLDYAKPWKLQLEPTDVAALGRRVAGRQPGVTLAPGWPERLVVRADGRRLEQALTNLVENARGASSEGCTLELEAGPPLRLHVCDNGPGVPPDIRQRLFEPFASRSPGGTGLGLSIVARIAQAHGGRALLSDRPPWRTCFTLELPHE
jgi:signal transduction histidine kinase